MKSCGDELWWCLHNIRNEFNTTELYHLEVVKIVNFVMCILQQQKKAGKAGSGEPVNRVEKVENIRVKVDGPRP